MKHIPNILSVLRIPLSISLLFMTASPVLYIPTYFVCGLTDVMDGYLARRFHWETKFGAKIDSIGDFVMLGSVFSSIFFVMKIKLERYMLLMISAVATLKATNLVLTRIKFKQWNAIHTIAGKLFNIPLFISLPVCMLVGAGNIPKIYMDVLFTALICGAALVVFEETLIIIRLKEYDANTKSVFMIKNKK